MATLSQRSFSGGEISPSLHGRVDTAKFQTGVKTMRNFVVLPEGGTANRPGTEYVCPVHDQTRKVRLIPFIFNRDQTYLLEFGHTYIRILKDGVEIKLIENTPYLESELDRIQYTQSADVMTLTHKSHPPKELKRFSETDWTLVDVTFATNTGPEGWAKSLGTGGSNVYKYVITAISDQTKDESLPSASERQYILSTWTYQGVLRFQTNLIVNKTLSVAACNYFVGDKVYIKAEFWTGKESVFIDGWYDILEVNIGGVGTPVSGVIAFRVALTGVGVTDTLVSGICYRAYATIEAAAVPTATAPNEIRFYPLEGATEYNIYKEQNGVFGFIGSAQKLKDKTLEDEIVFKDIGQAIQGTENPPSDRTVWSAGDYPAVVALYQQRRLFASSDSDVEKVYGTRIGNYKSFIASNPIQDDDSFVFRLGGQQVNEVRHMVALERLLMLTSAGEWVITGDTAGILTPTDINPKQSSNYGASYLMPLVAGASALFVQAKGSNIRDLTFEYQADGYRGNDLTTYARHLFKKYQIVSWAYQQAPFSIVWAVRDDGSLVGLTYVKEQEIIGWHRHDFDGEVEQVCSLPGATEDLLYLVIKRTINGQTKRYIERLSSRAFSSVEFAKFVDCSLTYNGVNSDQAKTVTLSAGTNWTYDETLTLTASSALFSASDVNNRVDLTLGDEVIRFTISAFTSSTVVTGKVNRTVPIEMRGQAISSFSLAKKTITGLAHLEGKEVSVLGDGYVLASPFNPDFPTVTVTNGTVTLSQPASVVQVGLPIISDLETLDIDTAQGESIIGRKKYISEVSLRVEDTRGIFIGPKEPTGTDPIEGLVEFEPTTDQVLDQPTALISGFITVVLASEWNSNGRVFIRQIDPLPLTVLHIAPTGLIPFRS